MADSYLQALANKAEIPMPPAGWPSQARYDYLVQFQQRAGSVMEHLPSASVYGAAGDVVQAADAFRREFTSQSSSLWSIIAAGQNLVTSVGMGKFLAFLWVVYLSAQRGMGLHQPAYQQASVQSGSITAQLLEYDYKLRLGAFHMLVLAADSGVLNPLFQVKSGGAQQNGLGEPVTLSAGVVVLTIAVVALIAFMILGLYLLYEHNKVIEQNCKAGQAGNVAAQSLCEKLALQQGAAIANAAQNASDTGNKLMNAAMWIGIAYVGFLLLPNIISAVSSARRPAAA